MHPEQVLDTRALPARTTLMASTPRAGGRVGGSPSLETLYGSAAEPISSERTTFDVAIRRAQTSTPGPATGATSAPRQQNTLNVLCDQRGGPTHQPASNTQDFRQGAYIQQDHPGDRMPGYRQLAPLAHTHNSASSGDPTQTTYEHWHHGNTLPPIKTQLERRQNSSTPTGHDRWRGQRQYHRSKILNDTREHFCDKDCDTYESHIMENRHLEDDPDGGEKIPVHGTSHMGPPLKPLDPPATEIIAQKQQLYMLRKQEAEEYPVADTY